MRELIKCDMGTLRPRFSPSDLCCASSCDIQKKRTSLACLFTLCLSGASCQTEEERGDEGMRSAGDILSTPVISRRTAPRPCHPVSPGQRDPPSCWPAVALKLFALLTLPNTPMLSGWQEPSLPFRLHSASRRHHMSGLWGQAYLHPY